MRASRIAAAAFALWLPCSPARAEDLSTGGSVYTDQWTNDESPPASLLDGDESTHFCANRIDDWEFRVLLARPGIARRIIVGQGYEDWSLPVDVQVENAYGEQTTITLQTSTRDPQTFDLGFEQPTALLDIHVLSASSGGTDPAWGGLHTLVVDGDAVGEAPAEPPVVSNAAATATSAVSATVTWTTDVPATSQVVYSTTAEARVVSPVDAALTTEHSVEITADAALAGLFLLRSADAKGNLAEAWLDAFPSLDTAFRWGMGGVSFHLNETWVPIQQLLAEDEVTNHVVQMWVGGGSWTGWVTAELLQQLVADGYTPELIDFYFGSTGAMTVQAVEASRDAYLENIQTIADLLQQSGVGAQVLVTLEPEYNQGDVADWDGWNDLMLEAIGILHGQGAKVGLLPGDWDLYHQTPLSMGRAASAADFVAFQEMRASTQDTPEEAYSIVDNAARFTHYLRRKFHRPVRLGYLMVSAYGGWNDVQRNVLVEMCERQAELEDAGLVGIAWMGYLDNESEGGYFGEAESYKGLKTSTNQPKRGFHVWKECVNNGPSWLETGEEPPGADGGATETPSDDSGCSCRAASGRPMPRSALAWVTLGAGLAALTRRRRTGQRRG